MPIDYRIDHGRRLVVARGRGSITNEEVFGYQREVWTRPELAGYDELVDMSGIERVVVPTSVNIKELAELGARLDHPSAPTKLAIVATDEIALELAHVFRVYRQLEPQSTKEVSVFKAMPEALGWLGVQGDLE